MCLQDAGCENRSGFSDENKHSNADEPEKNVALTLCCLVSSLKVSF